MKIDGDHNRGCGRDQLCPMDPFILIAFAVLASSVEFWAEFTREALAFILSRNGSVARPGLGTEGTTQHSRNQAKAPVARGPNWLC